MLVYYTLVGSLPFLLAIVFIHSEVSNPTIGLWSLPKPGQLLLWVPFFLPFAFKFPLFPFHS